MTKVVGMKRPEGKARVAERTLINKRQAFCHLISEFGMILHPICTASHSDSRAPAMMHPSNCIGRKKLSHVHIKPHTMTRAMTFGKGLPESEVVY